MTSPDGVYVPHERSYSDRRRLLHADAKAAVVLERRKVYITPCVAPTADVVDDRRRRSISGKGEVWFN